MSWLRQPLYCLLIVVLVVSMSASFNVVRSQDPTSDPDEAGALKKILEAWKITVLPSWKWNVSGDMCSGVATEKGVTIDDYPDNPLIRCDCSFSNSNICRITALRFDGMNITGPIPEELWNLTHITNLNLNKNLLSGPLSPGIGNLTDLVWLTFGVNALSGPLPKEIGKLTKLRSIGLDMNNFSGSLPPEIGNCSSLEKIYISSLGLTGEIPSSFANLVKLTDAWIYDIPLSGQIPDFIGKWTKLTNLRIHGTNFSGPIPPSFANLTSLQKFTLGDISNSNSSLEFIRDMKSLQILILRNNNLTGAIPSNMDTYLGLEQLDLSFNNLTGPIPDSLFTSNQLKYLFLGDNMLNGSLPAKKSGSLQNIDVSYNDLSGSLPSWVNEQNFKPNLVANKFTLGNNNKRNFHGLDCLQKTFPCNRGSGKYFNFFVNCGGPNIKSTTIIYEKDEEIQGASSFFVSKEKRWAVSSAGIFLDSGSNVYRKSTSKAQRSNTSDFELLKSARISPSSLRYYGLGLQNGAYTVTLEFSEIQIQDSNTWQRLGRRIFDIYVQGILVEKEFDIHKTANSSNVQVIRRYKANVTENYLEIHLFWAGKGTTRIPDDGTYGPLVSAISATPDFKPSVKPKIGIIAGSTVGAAGLLGIFTVALFLIFRKKRRSVTNEEVLVGLDVKPITFSYSELRSATQDFDPTNKLGEGGFGPVYKGKLNDGREIAVKQLSVGSRQGKDQFVAEIATVSAVQHRNLVKLYGCCIEGDQRMLVYEYLSNKSLDQLLFEKKSLVLGWSNRFGICLGVAKGLAYIHEESNPRIVHRDVKASNILLDMDLIPKISDFGLAKLYDDNKTHISTRLAGTIGYLSPEYVMLGQLTEKADVFAFGVMALEIVTGRPNSSPEFDDDRKYLLEWAWRLHENKRDLELVDPVLKVFEEEEVKRVIGVAFLCTQTDHLVRPAMSRVVGMLSGDAEVNASNVKPGFVSERKFESGMSFMSDSTSTSSVFPNSLHE